MSTSLDGKVCIVTGGAGGIGSAIVKAYLDAGALGITIVDRQSAISGALDRLPSEHWERVLTVAGDVTDPATHDAYISQTVERWGRVDISAQVAGTCSAPAGILDTKLEDWDNAMAVNGRGVFLGLRASVAAMLASPSGGKNCAVVLIASQFGLEGLAGFSAYAASKFAVRGLMQVAAQEFAPAGIRVNAICPGPIDTQMLKVNTPAQIGQILQGVPLGRLGQPEEIAAAALFLSSAAGAFCSGTSMKVDGGMAKFA